MALTMEAGRFSAILLCLLPAWAHADIALSPDLELSGRIGVGNAAVYRGLRVTDETLVPTLDVNLDHQSGLYLRGALTRVELTGLVIEGGNSMWQTRLESGYRWRFLPDWSVNATYNKFWYSDGIGDNESDYVEWSASLHYSNYATVSYHYTDDLWGLDIGQKTLSLSGRWPLARRLIGEAALGLVERGRRSDYRYSFLRVNLGYLIRNWSMQLQFHSTLGENLPYRSGRIGEQWIVELNWHW